MPTTNIYKVHYHFESSGKKSSPEYIDYISAPDSAYNTIKTVLGNNGKLLGSGTLQISSVQTAGCGGPSVLT